MKISSIFNSRQTILILIITTAVSLSFGLDYLGFFSRLESTTFDSRVEWFRSQKKIHDDVVVVLIDDYALQALADVYGRWPWPRSAYQEVLEYFSLAGAQTVAFDILFSEQQDSGGEQESDQLLIEATRKAGNAVHAMQLLHSIGQVQQMMPTDFVDRFAITPRRFSGPIYNDFLIPLDGLYQASQGMGFLEISPDRDGVYRRVRLFNQFRDGFLYPSLASSIVLPLIGNNQDIEYGFESSLIGNLKIPLDGKGNFLINPYGKLNTISVAKVFQSMAQIKAGQSENLELDPAQFSGKLVLLGASAVGLLDVKATALDSKEAGVFLHAYAVSNLLQQDFLTSTQPTTDLLLMLLFCLICTLPIVLISRLWLASIIPLVVSTGYLIFAWGIFVTNQIFPVIPIVFAIAISLLMSYSYRTYREKLSKQKVRKMLGQYVSPDVLSTLVDNREELHAEIGNTESLSILFTDIRGFTNISESLEASQVVELLNIYFSEMTDVIFEYHGTLDKFIGDAIMCFWGAPLKIDDHALQSVQCAMEMQQELSAVNHKLVAKGLPQLEIGIGIHSGNVILGNIGSDKKLDYTIIGDGVNLASRVEGLTKSYGCSILLSDSTRNQTHDQLPFIPIDKVRVKGKKQHVILYAPTELFHTQNQIGISVEALQQVVTAAFENYQNQNWALSASGYGELGNCVLSEIFLERCNQFQNQKPDSEWDGVYTFTKK